jgi:hypothetical protein
MGNRILFSAVAATSAARNYSLLGGLRGSRLGEFFLQRRNYLGEPFQATLVHRCSGELLVVHGRFALDAFNAFLQIVRLVFDQVFSLDGVRSKDFLYV